MSDEAELTWVQVYQCSTRMEAELIRNLLERSGIPAFVQADDAGGMYPSFTSLGRGATVWVEEQNGTQALELIHHSEAVDPEDS